MAMRRPEPTFGDRQRPCVIIVGGGFARAGMRRARWPRAPVDIVLIDRQNHHCFQPLLYQVATAALSPADIAWPIRAILSRQTNLRVIMATVTAVDTKARIVHADGLSCITIISCSPAA